MTQSIEMEIRQCDGCATNFKVMATSSQRFHSRMCESLMSDRASASKGKQPLKSVEREIVEIAVGQFKEPPNAKEQSTAQFGYWRKSEKTKTAIELSRQNNGQKRMQTASETISRIKSESLPTEETNTKKILQSKMQNVFDGPEKIESDSLNTTGSSMQEIEKNNVLSKGSGAIVESPEDTSEGFNKTLQKEELSSMSLIDESTKQLHGVMKQIIDRKKELSETQKMTGEEVYQICSLAGNISKLMKVKIDAMKVARSALKEMKK